MEGKEELDPKEEVKKTIDHFLNDFDEYPDIWLTDEEKKAVPEQGSKLWEKKQKWLHNKYSATWLTNVLSRAENIFIPMLPENRKEEFFKKWQELFHAVQKEQVTAITKGTVQKADQLLRGIKEAIL